MAKQPQFWSPKCTCFGLRHLFSAVFGRAAKVPWTTPTKINSELPALRPTFFFPRTTSVPAEASTSISQTFFQQTNARSERTAAPFANLFRSVAGKNSTWNSAARDVAKCIKKIARIRWKRLSLALVFSMVWREVRAGLNCERCVEERKKIHLRLAVKTEVGVVCRFMHHTLTATQVKTVKTRSTVAQAKGAWTTKQADRSKKRGKIWHLFSSSCAQQMQHIPGSWYNVDDFFFCCRCSARISLLLHGDPSGCTYIGEKKERENSRSPSSCALRRSMICTDCTTLTSDSKCSSLPRTKE